MRKRNFASLLLILIGIAYELCRRYQAWLYIPGLLMWIRVGPVHVNEDVVWRANGPMQAETECSKRPNIVLILVDDLGFNDISFYGPSRLKISTPNIDSLGRQGVAFTQAYAGHATCAPSRAALLTGRLASTVGYEYTPTHPAYVKILGTSSKALRKGIYHADRAESLNTSRMNLPLSEVTIARALREAFNYSTAMIGKWHLGETAHPTVHGFHQSLGFNLLSRYLPAGAEEGVEYRLPDLLDQLVWASARYQVSKDGEQRQFSPRGYLTDYFAEEADAAITANRHNPFFLYLSLSAPHTPYHALRSDYDKLGDIHDELSRVYAAMILAVDRAVGTVLQSLERNGLTDNTIVIFTNDNGAPNWSMQPEINSPFRGWKASLFEGGVRVPLLLQWPGVVPAGSTLLSPVSHVDLFPTLLAAADMHCGGGGAAAEEGGRGGYVPANALSGVNLLPALVDTSPGSAARASTPTERFLSERVLFWRSGHYKALRRGRWKLQRAETPDKIWLFDLDSDPYERTNLADVEPHRSDVLPDLLRLLRQQDSEQREPLWPSITETAVLLDKLFETNESLEDEYVYWPN